MSRTARFGWAVALPMLLLGQASQASGSFVDEYAVKAAFLYNFTRFVEWPGAAFESDPEVFRICVFGSDPFGERLAAIQRRSVGHRAIEIERSRAATRLPSCHIAYLGRARDRRSRRRPPASGPPRP